MSPVPKPIVLLILDATEPVTDQDQQLAGLLREHTKSVIIVVNKWDESEDNSDAFRNDAKKSIYNSFPHLDFAPIVFVCFLFHFIFDQSKNKLNHVHYKYNFLLNT